MALWLSDPDEDDEDVAEDDDWAVTNEAGIQIGNVLVEGDREFFDKRVNDEGNQPIPQPTTPRIEKSTRNKRLLLAQPEEQEERLSAVSMVKV